MYKIELCFTCERVELWTPFISARRLNTESLSCTSGELNDFSPILILAKTEDLGCLSSFKLQNI